MHSARSPVAALVVLLVSCPAAADEASPAPAAPAAQAPQTDDVAAKDTEEASTGFQMAVRTGVQIPLGKSTDKEDLSDVTSPQAPFILDLGGKVFPNLFLGFYGGLAVGGAGGKASDFCDQTSLSCSTLGFRFGLQVQYHIIPDGKINPWVGYGLGYEIIQLNSKRNDDSVSVSASGVEFAHLMAGADFRLTRTFGLGPFVDFSVGQYSTTGSESTINGTTTSGSGDIKDTGTHQWLMVGARFVLFP